METLILTTKDKKESKLLLDMLLKMQVEVHKLSKQEQEDYMFGKLMKKAVKEGEVKKSAIDKIIKKWK